MTLCEENCDLISYNYTNEKVKCSCDIKTNINPNYDYLFNKNEFFKSFTDIKNIANINIMKCYQIVIDIKNLIRNYGFYIIGSIMLLYIMTAFIYWIVSYKKIKKDLFNMSMILDKNKPRKVEHVIKVKKNIKEMKMKKNKRGKHKKAKNKDNNANNININIYNINNDNKNLQNNNAQIKIMNNDIKDFEINSFEYEEAFKLDKRNYIQYYSSLLKYNHPLIFAFCISNDYNSRIIKIFLFFFSFSSDLTINALFFNDDTMHKIYQDRGKFDLLFQIPQILYSTLISKLIDTLIKTLALSQDIIVELKNEKEKYNINKKIAKALSNIKIKFILFYIFNLLFYRVFGIM